MSNFQDIQNKHLALAQYYRWYQVYEMPFTKARINNQKDILAEDVEIISATGTSKGKADLEERLKVYEGWQNAHHVKHIEVKQVDEHTLSLEADILYQSIRPDNSRHSYAIHYSMLLELRKNDLPVFKHIHLQPTGTIEDPQFAPAYAENRAMSFIHYWFFCVETAHGNAERFKELVTDDFEFDFGERNFDDNFEEFKEWMIAFSQRVKISGHTPKDIAITANSDQTISVSMQTEWHGVLADEDEEKTVSSHHEWLLENNPDGRFAKMKKIKIKHY